jgi:hypothetical protein
MKKKKITEKENEWKGVLQQETPISYQESKPNITSNSYNPTVTIGSDFDIDKENINVDIDKDCNKITSIKNKRIRIFNTFSTFWHLIPSVAVHLTFKEVELNWLCFAVLISFKKN